MQNIIRNLENAKARTKPQHDVRTDQILVTIYAVEHIKTGDIVYVGASTDPEARWRRPAQTVKLDKIIHLEETILLYQVERETFWIEEMLKRGYKLSNKSAPQRIQVSSYVHELPQPHRNRPPGKLER
jgi:hypothetical protein